MPKITGFNVVAGDNVVLAADAFGNNVALRCPSCAWPVLLIARQHQRGGDRSNPAKCHGCEAIYWLEVDASSEQVKLHRTTDKQVVVTKARGAKSAQRGRRVSS